MPVTLEPDALHALAEGVLACACAALEDTEYGCPCRACVVPAGQAAADNCCEDCGSSEEAKGTLYVTTNRLYPTNPFPVPASPSDFNACLQSGLDLAVDLSVWLFRCTPGLDEFGNPPSCDALERAAHKYHADGLALYRGLLCCLPGLEPRRRNGRRFVMQPLVPAGPGGSGAPSNYGGGCQGWRQDITVALEQVCPCPPPASPVSP